MPEFPGAQAQNTPIYILPHLYIYGLNISLATDPAVLLQQVLAIAPGQCRDDNNQIDMPVGFTNLEDQGQNFVNPPIQFNGFFPPLFLDATKNGANGLDYGSFAGAEYAIYLIADSRGILETASLLTLTSNAFPLMPFGYDSKRLIGFASAIDADESGIFFTGASLRLARGYGSTYYQTPLNVLAAGNATVFTAINMTPAIPSALPYTIAYLLVRFTPSDPLSYVQFRNFGSTATGNLVTINAVKVGFPQQQYIQVICGLDAGGGPDVSLEYAVYSSSDSVDVFVAGYAQTV